MLKSLKNDDRHIGQTSVYRVNAGQNIIFIL